MKIDWKLDREEVEGVFGTWDIELIVKQISWQIEDDRKLASANTNGGGVGRHDVPGDSIKGGRFWVDLWLNLLGFCPPPVPINFDTIIIQGILATLNTIED